MQRAFRKATFLHEGKIAIVVRLAAAIPILKLAFRTIAPSPGLDPQHPERFVHSHRSPLSYVAIPESPQIFRCSFLRGIKDYGGKEVCKVLGVCTDAFV